MLDNNENLENLDNNSENRADDCCCEKKPLPNIPICSYEFTNVSAKEDTCEEKMESRRDLLNKIRSLDFAIVELAEYLDTHPTDEKALRLHKEYANALHDLKTKYQRIYGPLSIKFPCKKWRWIEEPWPWERSDF